MNKFVKVCAAFVAAVAFSTPALAQDAKTLDELLQMIESAKLSESADYRNREAAFNAANNCAGNRLFVFEEFVHFDPGFFAARFVARENCLAERVFDTLKININGVANFWHCVFAGRVKLTRVNAAFRF